MCLPASLVVHVHASVLPLLLLVSVRYSLKEAKVLLIKYYQLTHLPDSVLQISETVFCPGYKAR